MRQPNGARLERIIPGGALGLGLALALLTAVISGVSVFVNFYAVKHFHDPTAFTTLKNTMVGMALLMILALSRPQSKMHLTRGSRIGIPLLGLIGGSIPFVLFFEGLARANATDAALIQKTIFIWVAPLAILFLRERIGALQICALLVLVFAQVILAGQSLPDLGSGQMMILAATLLWSVEIIIAKNVLRKAPLLQAATGRMAVGAVILLVYSACAGHLNALLHLSQTQWSWGVATSLLLLAYVTCWYSALRHAPATAVTCVLTIGAPITALLSAVAGRGMPTAHQLDAYGLTLFASAVFAAIAVISLGRGIGKGRLSSAVAQ
jgi:drug/metabolite transporter (DMT)-like permease